MEFSFGAKWWIISSPGSGQLRRQGIHLGETGSLNLITSKMWQCSSISSGDGPQNSRCDRFAKTCKPSVTCVLRFWLIHLFALQSRVGTSSRGILRIPRCWSEWFISILSSALQIQTPCELPFISSNLSLQWLLGWPHLIPGTPKEYLWSHTLVGQISSWILCL